MSTNENRISPDDPRLTAFALDELEGEELAQMEAELRADPAAQAIVAQIRVAAEQFQAALAGETVEAAASGEGAAQPARQESHSIFRRFLLWGIPLAACLAVLLVREDLRRLAQEPEGVVAPSHPVAETAAKVPAPVTVMDSVKAVNAVQARGYFTPNTTGARLANNIGDIPSSVTVIDKQQLKSTDTQNINDIVMYEAGTQGSHTFTPETGFKQSTRIDENAADRSRVEESAAAKISGGFGGSDGRAKAADQGPIATAMEFNAEALPMPAAGKPPAALVPRRNLQISGLIGGAGGRGTQGVSGAVSTSTGTYEAAAKDLGNITVQVSDNAAWILSQIDRGVSFDQLTAAPEDFNQPGFSDAKFK